jgi:diadenosine tetraphosphatase ApaH/serine/threonine PP2A family protein phosphatase
LTLTVVITDIHGCYDQLLEMMDIANTWNDDPKKFIFLGDYVDRGPDSAMVIQYMIDHPEFICLKGNHEDMMEGTHGSGMWLRNGGVETLQSYTGVSDKTRATHLEWIKALPLYYEDEHRIYVHAGLQPGIELENQSAIAMIWIREEFLHSDYDFGKLVIHGHTPRRQVDIKPNRINLDTGGVFGNKFTVAFFREGERDLYKYMDVKGYSRPGPGQPVIKK